MVTQNSCWKGSETQLFGEHLEKLDLSKGDVDGIRREDKETLNKEENEALVVVKPHDNNEVEHTPKIQWKLIQQLIAFHDCNKKIIGASH